MSFLQPQAPNSRGPGGNTNSIQSSSNPFHSVFDGGNGDDGEEGDDAADEWWDEEERPKPRPPNSPAPSSITLWPRPPEGTGLGLNLNPSSSSRTSTRKSDKRYSVHKPTRDKSKGRQRKQNAKAGIKVVTDFRQPQTTKQPAIVDNNAQPSGPAGRFVELADLEALKGKSTQKPIGFWRSKKEHSRQNSGSNRPKHSTSLKRTRGVYFNSNSSASTKAKPVPSDFDPEQDLSPNDRPIVIGLSIPSGELPQRSLSSQTSPTGSTQPFQAFDRYNQNIQIPETPTIIITPANQSSPWAPQGDDTRWLNSNPRPASSVYSQAVYGGYDYNKTPPVPQMPAAYLVNKNHQISGQSSFFSPDSDDASIWPENENLSRSGSKSRPFSTSTVFEDESPIATRDGDEFTIQDGSKILRHASVSTNATRRRSKGWWNYITTPFLTRSNTFADHIEDQPRPALPSLTDAAIKALETERKTKLWEKEFSPTSPDPISTSAWDAWWHSDMKHAQPTQSPVLQETRHKVQTSKSTLPEVMSESVDISSATISSMGSTDRSELHNERSTADSSYVSRSNSCHKTIPTSIFSTTPRELQGKTIERQSPPEQVANDSTRAGPPVRLAAQLVQNSIISPPKKVLQSSPAGPPPYSPTRVRYRAVFPPGHALATQYPASPGPLSPEMQQAMSSRGAIPMSDVPLTPPIPRPINLNSGYPSLPPRTPATPAVFIFPPPPSSKAKKAEAKRRRHEKEEVLARKAGGLWRGRGCVSDRGCYGRSGPEGRKRRRWYLGLVIGFFLLIVLIVVLATTLHRKSNTAVQPSQWLNLTGFPPIYLGLSTVVAPVNILTNTGCVFPATQWSCDLPKELQASVSPNQPNQPNFILEIQWDNSSSTNATFQNVTGHPTLVTRSGVSGPVSAGQFMKRLLLKARDVVTFIPSPTPPSYAEAFFLGNTTDGIVSDNKAGEPTPFYISFLSSLSSSLSNKRGLASRQDVFPNITSIIPSPSLNSDGTAAPANLLPTPTQQPIRLYDRGLPTEHYGFYTYYDRSIFLKSLALLNDTNINNGEVPDDENGGATEAEANFRCTWAQTRFLVQMWTRMNSTTQLLNSTSHATTGNATTDFFQPGTFPYPTTITTDRHGGDPALKMIYCYEMNSREGLVSTSGQLNAENRGFGGVLINAAPSIFSNTSDPTLGGYDGGTGGCSCQWSNFQNIASLG